MPSKFLTEMSNKFLTEMPNKFLDNTAILTFIELWEEKWPEFLTSHLEIGLVYLSPRF